MPWAGAACLYAAVTIIVTYPLINVAATSIPSPAGDALLNAWILWWNSQTWPLTASWWNASMFYPTPGTLAFSEVLIGLWPIATPVLWWSGNPILAHNTAVLLSFPLCAMSTHALGYELTRRHDAALIAGLAFGFSPYRANEMAHVQMLSYYWAPLVLLALHRYRASQNWRWLVAGGAAFVLQSLCNGYALFHVSVLIALWAVWFAGSVRHLVAIAVMAASSLLVLAPVLLGYRAIHEPLHLSRSITDVVTFSADLASLFSAPLDARLLGPHLDFHQSYGLFPGVTILVLLAAGIAITRRPAVRRITAARRWLAVVAVTCAAVAASVPLFGAWAIGPLTVSRMHKPLSLAILATLAYFALGDRWRQAWRTRSVVAFYALAAGVLYVLAFGPVPRLFGERVFYQAPYAWLMRVPGFNGIRAPDRFGMTAAVGLAIVSAFVYLRLVRRAPAARTPLLVGCAIGLILDGWIRVTPVTAPERGPEIAGPDAVAHLELPLHPDTDAIALYRSVFHRMPLINGASGYTPPHYSALSDALAHAEIDAIHEFGRAGPIHVVVARHHPASATLEQMLVRSPDVTLLSSSDSFASYRFTGKPAARAVFGPELRIRRVAAVPDPASSHRLTDRQLHTTWDSRAGADNGELRIELDGSKSVGGIILEIGTCSSGYPRELVVETSVDDINWNVASRGRTALATLRAALDDPSRVPVAIPLPATETRFLRLRQVAEDAGIYWCVAELSVHAPR